jgi:hypothetical protein
MRIAPHPNPLPAGEREMAYANPLSVAGEREMASQTCDDLSVAGEGEVDKRKGPEGPFRDSRSGRTG